MIIDLIGELEALLWLEEEEKDWSWKEENNIPGDIVHTVIIKRGDITNVYPYEPKEK